MQLSVGLLTLPCLGLALLSEGCDFRLLLQYLPVSLAQNVSQLLKLGLNRRRSTLVWTLQQRSFLFEEFEDPLAYLIDKISSGLELGQPRLRLPFKLKQDLCDFIFGRVAALVFCFDLSQVIHFVKNLLPFSIDLSEGIIFAVI